MRALWLADVLTDVGLVVKPYPGWETRGKDDFSPKGHMLHHTVTKPSSSDAAVDKLLAVTGSSTTSAPLANISTNRAGTISIIAAGTANHGGAGVWQGVSGNRYWVGDEMKNLGTSAEPWPAVQIESALRAAAAVLAHIGSDEGWLTGHKEYATPPGRKTDPHTLNMNTQRVAVAELLEDDMPLSDEDVQKVAQAVALYPTRVPLPDGKMLNVQGALTRIANGVNALLVRPGADLDEEAIAAQILEAFGDNQARAIADKLIEILAE